MNSFIKSRFKKTVFKLLLVFIVLFVFRLIYGYQTVKDPTFSNVMNEMVTSSYQGRKNYASKKYSLNVGVSPMTVDQKYEKIAEIKTKSSKFEQEEKLARNKIENFNALIQFEQKSGNKGHRKLNLVIGVPPENFDSLYLQLITIGKIQAKQITKKDKTNEYKELNAKKQSLEKINDPH